jgi:hypothetical protein
MSDTRTEWEEKELPSLEETVRVANAIHQAAEEERKR